MKLSPLFDRVVVLPQKQEEKTKSGILLANVSDKKTGIGEVVAVGGGGLFDGKETKMQLCVGDKVVYSIYAGSEIEIDKQNYVILRQTDVFGILED